MLVTALEPRRKGLSLLVLDGEPAMELDTQVLYLEGIRAGKTLTDEELFCLRQQSEVHRAKERALYLLGHRNHLRGELEEKLRRSFSPEAAHVAADRMQELGLLDDAVYGRELAVQLLERKGFAASRVRFELCRRGLDKELAEEIVQQLAPPPEDKLLLLLQHKYPRAAQEEKQQRRAVNALQRMGYRLTEIRQALRRLDDTIEINEDEE